MPHGQWHGVTYGGKETEIMSVLSRKLEVTENTVALL